MIKRCILLLCPPTLLGEGVACILRQVEDVELIGPWAVDDWTLTRLSDIAPDVVLVAEPEGECDNEAFVTSEILEHYVDLPVVRICLSDTAMRVHSARKMPASSAALLEVIRDTPFRARFQDSG